MSENTIFTNSTTSECDELQALLPAYVMGATTPEEANRVEALLPRCPEVAGDLQVYASLAEGLTRTVEEVAPPSHLLGAIMERVADDKRSAASARTSPAPGSSPDITPIVRRNRTAWGAAAAVLILLFVTNIYWLARLQALQQDFVSLQQRQENLLVRLSVEGLQQVALQSTTGEVTLASVFWNPTTNDATFYTNILPALEVGSTYQLWLINGDAPVSMGIFGVNSDGEGVLTFKPGAALSSFAAVAVSVEPAGGSTAPTTDPIAVGTVDT